MTTYTNRDTAPLAFHTFSRYVALPLGTLLTLIDLVTKFGPATNGSIDFNYTLIILILDIACLVGFTRWRTYAWYCYIAVRIVNVVYGAIVLNLCFLYFPTQIATALGQLLGTILIGALTCIYYVKRKPLFNTAIGTGLDEPEEEPPHDKAPEPIVRSDAQAVTVSYCYRCGSKLVPGASFCNQCGTPAAKME